MSNRARVGRYSLWQFRDFALDRGIAILIIGLLIGYLGLASLRAALVFGRPDQVGLIMAQVIGPIATIAVLIATNGIVSNDRKNGYYRFLFSKPVSPAVYYAQLFAVHLVGVVIALALLAFYFKTKFAPIAVGGMVLYTAIVYIGMGGIGFFISVATRYDWVVLSAIWLGAHILRAVYGGVSDFRSKLVQILPPVHVLDGVAMKLLSGSAPPATDVLWLVLYGAAFFALGVYLVTRRSMVD